MSNLLLKDNSAIAFTFVRMQIEPPVGNLKMLITVFMTNCTNTLKYVYNQYFNMYDV